MDRAADNHYVTAGTEEIAELPVASIAAPDCVLWLWAISSMLPEALYVMRRWGFAYKTAYAWVKDRVGLGYWARAKHEHLLIGTRGRIPAPTPGTQWASVIEASSSRPLGKAGSRAQDDRDLLPQLAQDRAASARTGAARMGWVGTRP